LCLVAAVNWPYRLRLVYLLSWWALCMASGEGGPKKRD
jgi:hypothetical protein